ncbi:MAG TPA: methyltransferase domain-containing protein, partial [Pseudonocardiaceae bacterium]|nr:methyltransferase domain-containing protein [Pseudonocardiaceae bacterium]
DPVIVVDLGCGPGTLTRYLVKRWPMASVIALDSSPEMVQAARERGIHAEVSDIRRWSPPPGCGLIVCNAVLQWVPNHAELLRQWMRQLPAGGWLAMQVPGNFSAPSHAEAARLAAEPPWRELLDLRGTPPVLEPEGYAAVLGPSAVELDVWETTYLHRLTGADPVLEWITGTALRPVRAALSAAEWDEFRRELAPRLRAAYPACADGVTWFPFRRIFAVAQAG